METTQKGYLGYLMVTQLVDNSHNALLSDQTLQSTLCKIMRTLVRHPFAAVMFEPEIWISVTNQCGVWLQSPFHSPVFFHSLKLFRSLHTTESCRSSAQSQLVHCTKQLLGRFFLLTRSHLSEPLGPTESSAVGEMAKVIALNFDAADPNQFFDSIAEVCCMSMSLFDRF